MTKHKSAIIICIIILASTLSGCKNSAEYHDGAKNNNHAGNHYISENGYNWELQLVPGNPIDDAFKNDFEIASSTPELNYLAEQYLEAWKMEWDHIISVQKTQYSFYEDKKVIEAYRQSFEDYAARASDLEWLTFTDTSIPLEDRHSAGTGAVSSSMLVEAYAYKRQVLMLIDRYYIDNNYDYQYKGSGAELLKLREEADR